MKKENNKDKLNNQIGDHKNKKDWVMLLEKIKLTPIPRKKIKGHNKNFFKTKKSSFLKDEPPFKNQTMFTNSNNETNALKQRV
jgi:hypothetical protein